MHVVRSDTVRKNRKLKWFNPILNKLRLVIDDYLEWEEEPPFWNNEAASISLLVAAATRAKCIALSDFRRYKWNQHNDVRGRCDLLIGNRNDYLEIEAKQIYVRPKAKIKKHVSRSLKAACTAAKQLWWGARQKRAGLLFAVLSISKKEARTFDFETFLRELKNVKADVIWYWYDSSFDKKFQAPDNERYYPGFVLFLKF
jgi:hypothetical protein